MIKSDILLRCNKSPGDILMLSAAVRDLSLQHSDKFNIHVSTTCREIWENNPYITPCRQDGVYSKVVDCNYPLINKSNNTSLHFIHGYIQNLSEQLQVDIKLTDFKGDIHLSHKEKKWMSQVQETGNTNPFWIICAGGKFDFTSKWWNPEKWQKVVDHFQGKIQFVQTGKSEHFHQNLNGVVDLVGKTNLRQYIRLFYHSIGVLSPITCAMHFAAAVPSKYQLQRRPCVVVASGMEPVNWEKYPTHQYISRAGTMDCCKLGGCWKSKCSQIIGEETIASKVCLNRIPSGFSHPKISDSFIPQCMDDISVNEVINAIETYYRGKILKYL